MSAIDLEREHYRRDPVAFLRDVLRFHPWSKQRAVIESVRDHRRTAVRSCHDVGKTAIAARAALWFLASFPSSRVVTTAPTAHQVENLLWREVHTAAATVGGLRDAKLNETELELAPDWFAVGLSTNEPERFAGHHAEHLLLVVDEASGVDQAIYDAAEGSLASEGARVLLIGNPTRLSGEFFNAFHRDRALWHTIAISAFDSPAFTGERVPDELLRKLVSREWVEEKRRKWGESNPLYQVRVLGEFPATADDTVCSLAEVEAAQARQRPSTEPVVVACDVARFGSDETVIAVRQGERVRIAKVLVGKDTMRVVGAILQVARTVKVGGAAPLLVVDDVGVGGGVVDRLRELREYRVVAFNGGARARQREEYPNRRSESWFAFAEKLPELDLDPDEQLAADLVAPRYWLDSHGRRVVEPKAETKKRLGRSPDRADAVLMALSTRGDSGVDRAGSEVLSAVGSWGDEGSSWSERFGRRSRAGFGDEREVGFEEPLAYDSEL